MSNFRTPEWDKTYFKTWLIFLQRTNSLINFITDMDYLHKRDERMRYLV